VRFASGIVIALVAVGIAFNADSRFATALPGYTQALQKHIEETPTARRALDKVTGAKERAPATTITAAAGKPLHLPVFGVAPPLSPSGDWFNSKPLTLAGLRGKVVLVDFWTYSCINCLRTLPHLESWYSTYRRDGLVIVGVHTPEFAFEHVPSNVGAAVKRLGIRYPVVQDNAYGTWTNYSNQYWPAHYLIDRLGRIRDYHFGEGGYAETEAAIRTLLGVTAAPAPVADTTPTEATTPETYLGYARLDPQRLVDKVANDRLHTYPGAVTLAPDAFTYSGSWKVEQEKIVSGRGAALGLHFRAKDVYLVLGGRGDVQVSIAGGPVRTVHVGSYRLYTLRRSGRFENARLDLRFTPGVAAYAFTFG
jgi:thiol-disulfide isomerase/thioredoxin